MDYSNLFKLISECIEKVEAMPRNRERSLVITKLEEAMLWAKQDKENLENE